MEKLKTMYNRNRIFVWTIGIALCSQLIYLSQAASNAPLMDYWKYLNRFVEKMFSSGLSWSDFWESYGIHRSPIQFIYFVLNVRLFHYDAQIEIYLGAVLMAVGVCVLYHFLKRDLECTSFKLLAFSGIAITIIVYNLNQWELIAEQFALSFATRLLLFLLGFLLTNRYLYNIERAKKYTGELGALYVITITLGSGGYFPAYFFAILVGIVFFALTDYHKNGRKYWHYYAILILFLAVGAFIYLYGINYTSASSEIDIKNFLYYLIAGSIVMLGVSLMGSSTTLPVTFAIGLLITVFALAMLILWIRYKGHKKSSVPIFLYAYTTGCLGLICLGRSGMYGFEYCFYSRYTCESNLIFLGIVWIVAMLLSKTDERQKADSTQKSKRKGTNKPRYIALIGIGLILCGVLRADFLEWKQAPNRKNYFDGLIQNMLNVDSLKAEDFSIFQAKEEDVRGGIELMEKYNLGIFRYEQQNVKDDANFTIKEE